MYTTDLQYTADIRVSLLLLKLDGSLEEKIINNFERRIDNALVRLDCHGINYHIPQPEQPGGSILFVSLYWQGNIGIQDHCSVKSCLHHRLVPMSGLRQFIYSFKSLRICYIEDTFVCTFRKNVPLDLQSSNVGTSQRRSLQLNRIKISVTHHFLESSKLEGVTDQFNH